MSRDLEELFGEGEGRPEPRTRLILGLLGGGLALTTAGMACTAVPGGIVILAAWNVVDAELQRVESGYLPASDRLHLQRMERLVYVALGLVVLAFLIQAWLLYQGFYEALWDSFLHLLLGTEGHLGADPPTP